jgi:hypothetical protein
LIVENIDLGARIVGHDDVLQTIAVNVRHVERFDLGVEGKNFRPGKTKNIRVRTSRAQQGGKATGRKAK